MRVLVILMASMLTSQVAYAQSRVTDLTTLSVVLVTFADDVPHGYTRRQPTAGMPHTLVAGDHAYTMDDFEIKFGVSGTFDNEEGITLDKDEELPAVYGSVKDYFDEMSGGESLTSMSGLSIRKIPAIRITQSGLRCLKTGHITQPKASISRNS